MNPPDVISVEDLLQLLGAKEAQILLLQRQIAALQQQVAGLAEALEKKPKARKERKSE